MKIFFEIRKQKYIEALDNCGPFYLQFVIPIERVAYDSFSFKDLISVNRKGYSFCKEGTPWPNAKDGRSLFITLYSYWENFGWVGSIKW
ncbi:hypothetical protein P8452_42111 [Trifolium repens]|nr:hypothetical protein P8452_42111 [Trifolium repens]